MCQFENLKMPVRGVRIADLAMWRFGDLSKGLPWRKCLSAVEGGVNAAMIYLIGCSLIQCRIESSSPDPRLPDFRTSGLSRLY